MHPLSHHQKRRVQQLEGRGNEVHVLVSNKQYCILIVHPEGDLNTMRRIAYGTASARSRTLTYFMS